MTRQHNLDKALLPDRTDSDRRSARLLPCECPAAGAQGRALHSRSLTCQNHCCEVLWHALSTGSDCPYSPNFPLPEFIGFDVSLKSCLFRVCPSFHTCRRKRSAKISFCNAGSDAGMCKKWDTPFFSPPAKPSDSIGGQDLPVFKVLHFAIIS